jgi:hypothetical protein
MTKSIQPVRAPVEIRVPGAPKIMTTIDIQTGKHVIKCDLCCSLITLTIGANPKAFFDHRTGARLVCSQTIKRKGLPIPLPKALPPRIIVSKASCSVAELPCPGLVPIHCQLCPPLAISGERRTIWKYNSIYHLLSEHSPECEEDDTNNNSEKTALPKIPGQMTVDMFISRKEEEFLKIMPELTTQYREKYENIPNSDGVEIIKDELKRERAQTLSVVEPGGKRRRK